MAVGQDRARPDAWPQPAAATDSVAAATDWAALPADEVQARLGTSAAGLSAAEARARLARHGPNTLPRPARRPWYLELGANFVHFFALLLWAGAGLAWLGGMPQLAWAIVAVIVINGAFSFWQEFQAERAAEALEALLPRQVTVRREGQEQVVPAAAVVPGDRLVLTEGEAVPADAWIVTAERLRVDASALTGESRPVPRSAGPVATAERTATELHNLVFAGTTIADGRGEALVFATGAATEFGRIARLTHVQDERPSPLQREIARVTRVVMVLSLSLGIGFFVVGTTLGGLPISLGFLFAIGIIVANVPEGLLPTLTLSLALGVRRMANRHALVKRLSAVEALGSATIILTDKTGTLTENEMTVREVWAGGARYRLTGIGYEPNGAAEPVSPAPWSPAAPAMLDGSASAALPPAPLGAPNASPSATLLAGDRGRPDPLTVLLRTAALCCDAHLVPPRDDRPRWTAVGDPTEAAILVAAAKLGLDEASLRAWPRLAELPFDSTRKRMTTIQEMDGGPVACIKGAPSELFARCTSARWEGDIVPFDAALHQEAEAANDALARRGLRVLAVATRSVDAWAPGSNGWRVEDVEQDLTLLGLLAMEDPPRPEVPAALAACHRAGIRVVMVTGDDGRTAAAIGHEIGLHRGEVRIIHGSELDALDDAALDPILNAPDLVFARVAPEHKLRLVEAYQRRGDVVAVTGDGVNDAPALKRADIGVAMGATGTDVAREAADMVLVDDDFASIVAAIEEGRAVFDNVRKFITYVLVSNVAEVAPFVAFMLFHVPLPLTIMQVLAVDLGTDMLPALALGMEPPEADVMDRPPRPREERLLNLPTILRVYGWLGLIEAACGLGGYFFAQALLGWRPGEPLAASGVAFTTATTMTFAGIVAGQVGAVFACRSSHLSIFQLGWASNRALLAAVACEVLLLGALIYVPPLAAVFELSPLGPAHWLLLALFPPALLACEEARKALRRRT
jgi:magnesium-transporting ATPase (P-type)